MAKMADFIIKMLLFQIFKAKNTALFCSGVEKLCSGVEISLGQTQEQFWVWVFKTPKYSGVLGFTARPCIQSCCKKHCTIVSWSWRTNISAD